MRHREGVGIGQLSRRTGCRIETIRYYERIRLLPAPARTIGGYRAYGDADIRRLLFVRRARELGFSLDDVRVLLRLADHAHDACADARSMAVTHLADVESKIDDLKAVQRALMHAVRRCDRRWDGQCPLIVELSSEGGETDPEGVP